MFLLLLCPTVPPSLLFHSSYTCSSYSSSFSTTPLFLHYVCSYCSCSCCPYCSTVPTLPLSTVPFPTVPTVPQFLRTVPSLSLFLLLLHFYHFLPLLLFIWSFSLSVPTVFTVIPSILILPICLFRLMTPKSLGDFCKLISGSEPLLLKSMF